MAAERQIACRTRVGQILVGQAKWSQAIRRPGISRSLQRYRVMVIGSPRPSAV
jgi:hypothetical protein